MTEPITYEIELNGNVGSRSLRPLIDNFSVDQSENGVTRLVGSITDASQLHGVIVHLASMSVEIISIAPSRNCDSRRCQARIEDTRTGSECHRHCG